MNAMLRFLIMLLVSCTFFSCKSNSDKLFDACKDLEQASQETQDCQVMANKISKASQHIIDELERVKQIEAPSQAEQENFVQAIGPCTRSLLTISVGSCKDDKAVQEALNHFSGAKE